MPDALTGRSTTSPHVPATSAEEAAFSVAAGAVPSDVALNAALDTFLASKGLGGRTGAQRTRVLAAVAHIAWGFPPSHPSSQ